MSELGGMLIFFGFILAVVGAIMLVAPQIPWLGKLPGDISYRGERFTFYFPLGTSILLSVILSLILYLFRG